MFLLRLALASLLNRRSTLLLSLLCIALASALLLGVERLRSEARASFTSTLSGTDLIVGARTSPLNLLLYSVFHIGNATSNIDWSSVQKMRALPQVKWLLPLSLGDSHRGYRVIGTSAEFFSQFRYGEQQALQLAQGAPFNDLFDVVLGAEVASALGYRLGDALVLAHGVSVVSLQKHDQLPFRVSGILARSGTPLDRSLLISLAGMQALHVDWQQGMPPAAGRSTPAERLRQMDLQPHSVTAVLIGLQQRIATFAVQRQLNQFSGEPLLAILPGVALSELWSLLGNLENLLLLMSAAVVLVGLVGMLTTLLASLNERRREMAILRALGARPWQIAALLQLEILVLAVSGLLLGVLLLQLGLQLAAGWLQQQYGLLLPARWPGLREWQLLGGILASALLLGLLPAWRAWRQSLHDGLSLRL